MNTEAIRTIGLAVADIDAAIANATERRATLAAEVADIDAQITLLRARRASLADVLPPASTPTPAPDPGTIHDTDGQVP